MTEQDGTAVQWFDQRHHPLRKAITLNKQKKGTASIPAAAHDALGNPEYIQLGFIPATRTIVMRAATADTPGAYPLRAVGTATTRVFSMKAFALAHGIPTGDVEQITGEAKDGQLFFPLKGAAEGTSTGGRGNRHAQQRA